MLFPVHASRCMKVEFENYMLTSDRAVTFSGPLASLLDRSADYLEQSGIQPREGQVTEINLEIEECLSRSPRR